MPEEVTCYCGHCKLKITGEPAMQVFCHCADCRRWGGSVAQAAKLYPKGAIEGSGQLLTKDKRGKLEDSNSWRFSCQFCGGVVVDDKSHIGFMMVPAGLSQKPFKPTMHINYASRIYDMVDGLPKYATSPKSFGGDDVLIPEEGVSTKKLTRGKAIGLIGLGCAAGFAVAKAAKTI